MTTENFYGVFPYTVSPVDEDGAVKDAGLEFLIEHLIQKEVHGLTPLGSTGEFAYLNSEQRRRIIEIVIKTASGRVPVVAGVSHPSVKEAVRQAREAESLGADGILIILQTYFKIGKKEIVTYFKSIAESVSLPVVLYSNPRFTFDFLSIDVLEQLLKTENIKYLKDASSNTGKLLTMMNHFGARLKVFSSSAHIPLAVMQFGGLGWMAGPACVIPSQSVKLYRLCIQKKWDEAITYQKKLWQINHIFQKYSLAVCIKTGLKLQGFDVGDPIPPLKPLSDEAILEIQNVLKNLSQDE